MSLLVNEIGKVVKIYFNTRNLSHIKIYKISKNSFKIYCILILIIILTFFIFPTISAI